MIKGLKICGICDLETLKFILNHKYPPKFIGFISNYKKSKRLTNVDRKFTNFVSVLVNPDDKTLDMIKNLNFDYYQLYDVGPKRAKIIKKKYKVKIITAITIKDQIDVDQYEDYLKVSDIVLFDGKGYEKSIGFDHKLLDSVPNSVNKMIAGNIKIEDIAKFKNKNIFIDLSGALENKSGKKDVLKINKLLNLANVK